jgi:hypothetical protein
MNHPGSGPSLRDASPWLKNDAQRRQRILEVVELNSVIEGLPPFQAETRQRLLAQLEAMGSALPDSVPAE